MLHWRGCRRESKGELWGGIQFSQLRQLANAVWNATAQFIAGEVPEERHGTVRWVQEGK